MEDIWGAWVPGVLSRSQLRQMCDGGFITGLVDPDSAIDNSAIDLHITSDAYHLKQGSVKPFGHRFLHTILHDGLAETLDPEDDDTFVLLPKNTYLFRLKERLEDLRGSSIWGQATAKSSIGRLDVLARLVVNGMRHYEGFNPKILGQGRTDMFVEITPITFPVKVREGVSVNQLRLFYGQPRASELTGEEISRTCFSGTGDGDHHLTVDLSTTDVYGAIGCGFYANDQKIPSEPIALWTGEDVQRPDPSKWWQLVQPDENRRLRIRKNGFYILRSTQRLTLPPGVAVYARAIDEEIGEMRIHYAGFAHPFFGWKREDGRTGTPLIFEVRGHDVDVNLRHGEVLARLKFFRLSQDLDDGGGNAYNEQELTLSKFFDDWSSPPTIHSS